MRWRRLNQHLNILVEAIDPKMKNVMSILLYSWSVAESNACSYWLIYGHVAVVKCSLVGEF